MRVLRDVIIDRRAISAIGRMAAERHNRMGRADRGKADVGPALLGCLVRTP
jgi:hypothetical protein